MQNLRKWLMIRFSLVSLLMMISFAVWDELSHRWLLLPFEKTHLALAILLALAGDIAIFALFIYLFYNLVSKKIDEIRKQDKQDHSLLFANIAHDLKTPLTAVHGYSKAIQDGLLSPDKLHESADRIVRKSKEASDLLDLLFTYSKLEARERGLAQTSIDLAAMLRQSIAQEYDRLEEKEFSLDLRIPTKALLVKIHPDEAERVFKNLLGNLVDHLPQKAKVQIVLSENEFHVTDNGETLNPELFEELKKPFVRKDESRHTQGSGLGLAICDSILSPYGYELHLRPASAPYKKTIFIQFNP